MSRWDETRREFCRIAAKLGVRKAANECHIGRMTAYRMRDPYTPRPSVQATIERFVQQHKSSKNGGS